MILFAIQIIYCMAQYQLTMVKNQRFFYKLSDMMQTSGLNIQVQSPNLEFLIQGGLTQSNSTLNISQIISSSLYEEMNVIAILQLDEDYIISTFRYTYDGQYQGMANLFNVSSDDQECQDILILDNNLIILHCTYITNNSIVIYNYNNTVYQYNSFISPEIISVDIQSYFNYQNRSYDIYFIYKYKFSSQIYYCQLYNNTFYNVESLWNSTAQYIQVYVSKNQEIFALQFNYLIVSNKQSQQKFPYMNASNWIAMNVVNYKNKSLIQLLNNYSFYEVFYQSEFQIISNIALPSPIAEAQIFTNLLYVYIITQNTTLIYRYDQPSLQLFQSYEQQSLFSKLNLYNTIGNIIIQISNQSINVYQISDYFLYNNNPPQSGYLQLQINNQTSYQIYINVIPYYDNQIYPMYQNFSNITLYNNNSYYVNSNIGQYFIGSNLSYSLSNTTLNGLSIINQTYMGANFENIPSLFSISYLNCLLVVTSTLGDRLNFYIVQNNQLNDQFELIAEYSSDGTGAEQFQSYFVQYENGTIMVLKVGGTSINVFQLQPLIDITQSYTLNMGTIQNTKSFNILSGFTHDHILFLNTEEYFCFVIEIFTTYYEILEQFTCNYTYVTGQQYDEYYIYATFDNQIDIFTWKYKQLQYQDTITIPTATGSLYVIPLINGVYVLFGNLELYYYEKSMFQMNNFGQQFYNTINTTGLTNSYVAYSDYYLYLSIRFNDKNYIYIYKCSDFAINALYQSILLDQRQNFISVTTDYIKGVDYLSVGTSTYPIYEIPHRVYIQQYPNGQLNTEYEIVNNITVSNIYDSYPFQLNIIVAQPQVSIQQKGSISNVMNNQTNGVMQVNPYNYFDGIIQSYNVSCKQCQNLQIEQILTNSSFYLNQSTLFSVSYIQDSLEYIYLANQTAIIQLIFYYNTSTYQYQGLIVNYTNQTIMFIFLEYNTNAISWIVQDKDQLIICSVIDSAIMNVSLTQFNTSNPALNAIYSYGFLQLLSAQYYYFYTYLIQNYTINITTYLQGAIINQNNGQILEKISLYNYEDNYILGVFYQTVANTIQAFIVEITISDYVIKLQGFQQIQLNNLIKYQQDLPFQTFKQIGFTEQLDDYSIVNFVYATVITGGIIQMKFQNSNLLSVQQLGQLEILDSSLQNSFVNLLTVSNNQIAILSINKMNSNLITSLSVYLVEHGIEYQIPMITPYSYINFNQSTTKYYSINCLCQNQLLFSIDNNTYFYQANQLLSINYNTTVNSSIIVSAYNQISSQSQTFDILFSNNQSNGTNDNVSQSRFNLYWIIIIIIAVIAFLLIISITYQKFRDHRQKDYLQHLDQQKEIEIKSKSNYKQEQ